MQLLMNAKFQTKEKDMESFKALRHTLEAISANLNQLQVTADQMFAEISISRLNKLTAGRFEDYIVYTS